MEILKILTVPPPAKPEAGQIPSTSHGIDAFAPRATALQIVELVTITTVGILALDGCSHTENQAATETNITTTATGEIVLPTLAPDHYYTYTIDPSNPDLTQQVEQKIAEQIQPGQGTIFVEVTPDGQQHIKLLVPTDNASTELNGHKIIDAQNLPQVHNLHFVIMGYQDTNGTAQLVLTYEDRDATVLGYVDPSSIYTPNGGEPTQVVIASDNQYWFTEQLTGLTDQQINAGGATVIEFPGAITSITLTDQIVAFNGQDQGQQFQPNESVGHASGSDGSSFAVVRVSDKIPQQLQQTESTEVQTLITLPTLQGGEGTVIKGTTPSVTVTSAELQNIRSQVQAMENPGNLDHGVGVIIITDANGLQNHAIIALEGADGSVGFYTITVENTQTITTDTFGDHRVVQVKNADKSTAGYYLAASVVATYPETGTQLQSEGQQVVYVSFAGNTNITPTQMDKDLQKAGSSMYVRLDYTNGQDGKQITTQAFMTYTSDETVIPLSQTGPIDTSNPASGNIQNGIIVTDGSNSYLSGFGNGTEGNANMPLINL